MPEPFTSPAAQPNPNIVKHDPATEKKLAELRAQNEAKQRRALDEDIEPGAPVPTVTEAPREPRRETPWALRAIAADGNVLKAVDWILKRDPTEEEKADFIRTVPRAVTVDLVRPKL